MAEDKPKLRLIKSPELLVLSNEARQLLDYCSICGWDGAKTIKVLQEILRYDKDLEQQINEFYSRPRL